MSSPLQIFISYAHEDSELRKELERHLKVLEREELAVLWSDREIGVGKEWEHEIDQNLEGCDIILLLITASFIASDYCYCIEMQRAMKRHNDRQARVIPIILRPVLWKITPFSGLQSLPQGGKAVYSKHWDSPEAAFENIATGIQEVIEDLKKELISSEDLHDSLLRLDFRSQGKAFDEFLKKGHRTGAFIIHGEARHGQDWLLNRFMHRLLERLNRQVPRGHVGKVCKLDFASIALKNDMETLWRELADLIGLQNTRKFLQPEPLIDSAYALSMTQTVVFILRNLYLMREESIKQFLDTFWSPLTTRYAVSTGGSSHYCLLFLIDNEDCIDNWTSIEVGPSAPTKLDKLMKFERIASRRICFCTLSQWTSGRSIS